MSKHFDRVSIKDKLHMRSDSEMEVDGIAIFNQAVTNNANVITNGNVTVTGNVDITGNFSVTGNTTNVGNTITAGNVTVNGNTINTGNLTTTGDVVVNGNTTNNGNVTTTGNVNTTGTTTNTGSVIITNDLTVGGTTTNNGNVIIAGNVTTGTIGTPVTMTSYGTLTNTGNLTINGDNTTTGLVSGNIINATTQMGTPILNATTQIGTPIINITNTANIATLKGLSTNPINLTANIVPTGSINLGSALSPMTNVYSLNSSVGITNMLVPIAPVDSTTPPIASQSGLLAFFINSNTFKAPDSPPNGTNFRVCVKTVAAGTMVLTVATASTNRLYGQIVCSDGVLAVTNRTSATIALSTMAVGDMFEYWFLGNDIWVFNGRVQTTMANITLA